MNRIDDMIRQMCPDGVEYKPLGDVGTFFRGNGLQKKDFVEEGLPCIHYGQIHTLFGIATDSTISSVAPPCGTVCVTQFTAISSLPQLARMTLLSQRRRLGWETTKSLSAETSTYSGINSTPSMSATSFPPLVSRTKSRNLFPERRCAESPASTCQRYGSPSRHFLCNTRS